MREEAGRVGDVPVLSECEAGAETGNEGGGTGGMMIGLSCVWLLRAVDSLGKRNSLKVNAFERKSPEVGGCCI